MERDEQIADLYGRWKDASAKGAPPSPQELCKDHPELLGEFIETLPRLVAFDALFRNDLSPPATPAKPDTPGMQSDIYRSLTYHKEGGLGVVFVGEDPELRRKVAVKCMKAKLQFDRAAVDRFLDEAEITARLDHPGVVPIYRLARDGEGRPYYAMRFVQGETYGERIRRFHQSASHSSEHHLEFRRLLSSLITVCETVAYAHSRGVVHRDLKPENIILGPFGETLVLDWGLAKSVHAHEPTTVGGEAPATQVNPAANRSIEGQTKGSPAFMSPEQARGEWGRVGPASDIFSLGATLYMLLTGRPPFQGGSVMATVELAKLGTFVAPRQINAQVPKPLEAICNKALSLEPADRYNDARDMANDVNRWLADEPVSAYREPLSVRTKRWLKRHRSVVAAGVTALVLIAAGATALAVQANHQNAQLRVAYEKEAAARADAERFLMLATRQVAQVMDASNSLELQIYHSHPVYRAVATQLLGQMEELIREAPSTDIAAMLQAQLEIARLYFLSISEPNGFSEGLRQQLFAARKLLEQAAPSDEWAGVNLAKTYAAEAIRLDMIGQPLEAAAAAYTAFDLFERYANVKTEFGRHSIDCAAGAAAMIGANAPDNTLAINKAQRCVEAAIQLLRDSFPHDPLGKVGRLSYWYHQSNLLTLIARLESRIGSREAGIAAAQEAIASVEAWPPQWRSHPLFLKVRSQGTSTLIQSQLPQKMSLALWDLIRSVGDDAVAYLQAIAFPPPELDRRYVIMMELGLALAAADLLVAEKNLLDLAVRQRIAARALQAIATVEALEELVPEEHREPQIRKRITPIREVLNNTPGSK